MTGKIEIKKNLHVQTVIAYGDIPSIYSPLVDLGNIYYYNGLSIANGTDVGITLKIGDNEIVTPPGVRVWDNYRHNGLILYKYTSDTEIPSYGDLEVVSW